MNKIIDLENVEFSPKNGTYGGNEMSKEGIIYNNELWMLKYCKYAKDFKDYESKLECGLPALSEFIGSNIFRLLGCKTQETILAKRYDSLVVICKDFTVGKEFIPISKLQSDITQEIKNLIGSKYNFPHVVHDRQIQKDIHHVLYNPNFTSIEGMTEHFCKQALIDILINNSDRFEKNWGVLKDEDGTIVLAPVFDNSNSLSTPLTSESIQELLDNDEKLYSYLLSSLSTYHAVRYLKYFIPHEELRKYIIEVVPFIESKLDDIFKFIDDIPEFQNFEGSPKFIVCDYNRKELYKKSLQIRFEVLLKPLYEAALNYQVSRK